MSVTTRASPTHSHESNGGAERAVQSVRGLARTLVTQVEHRIGLTFGADSPLWLWAFRHAGWILTRFGRRRDTGMTPYAKLFCKQYRQPLLMFAEAVIARRPGAQINKLEHQWLEGLWVGRDGSTDEHLVASEGGIVRCRAVKRMTEDRRWLAARFGSFQWTPWAPSAVQRGRPPKARGDAEPIRVGALGHEHLLMAPPAGSPAAAAPAAVAEPSVPIATEASSAQSSSSSSPASPPAVPEPEEEMTDPAADRKRDHSTVDQSSSATDEEDRGPMVIEDKASATSG